MTDEPYQITERGDPRDRITNQSPLFDVSRTIPTACPNGHCQAIRLPGQDRVVTCAHDLDPEHRTRPKGCLNSVDPATAPFPEGF